MNDHPRVDARNTGFLRGEPPAVLLVVGVLLVGLGFGMEAAGMLVLEFVHSESSVPVFGNSWHLNTTLRMLNNLLNVIGIAVIFFSAARAVASAAPVLMRQRRGDSAGGAATVEL